MDAAEARNARRSAGKKSLEQRLRLDPGMAAKIDRHLVDLGLEQQMIDAMEREHVTAAELARRVDRKPSAISRDLNGGLSKAKFARIQELANAVGHDVVPLVLPRDAEQRRHALERVARELTNT